MVNEKELEVRQEVLLAIHKVIERYVGEDRVANVWGELQERLELGFINSVGDIQAQIAVSVCEVLGEYAKGEK